MPFFITANKAENRPDKAPENGRTDGKNSVKKESRMKYFRLKKQSDFQRLFQKGKRAFSPSLAVIYRPSQKMTMGISIGKKHGKSVRRNRIKRLLREAFRAVQGEMNGTYSIVLIPKVSEEYSVAMFKKHLQWIIQKEKL